MFGSGALVSVLPIPSAGAAACDTEAIRQYAARAFPDYDATRVRSANGVVTIALARRDHAGTFAVGLRAAGGAFFTSVMAIETDTAQSAERERVGQVVADWYPIETVQHALEACTGDVSLSASEAQETVRNEAAAALGAVRLGASSETSIEVGTLLLSLGLVLVPGISRRSGNSGSANAGMLARQAAVAEQPVSARTDRAILCVIILAALTIALAVAWHLAPETDEVVTLGTRHQPFSSLLAWNVGGEPYNAPGTSIMFAAWLRVAKGFFAARLLSISLIPLTAWMAYRAGLGLSGRLAGLAFAGLVVLSPAYLRLAAISRGYSLIVLAICAVLAALADSERTPSRGVAMGLAGLINVWTSYLLWPLALAAPWLARLTRGDRLRVTAALVLMMAALAPRVGNAVSVSTTKTDVFELRTPAQVLGAAFATAGQAPPGGVDEIRGLPLLGSTVVALLIVVGVVGVWHRDRRRVLAVLATVLLVALPVLALLLGGRGIRERHVLGVQVVLALFVALGLGAMTATARGRVQRAVGALLIILLAAFCARGNIGLVSSANGWIGQLASLCSGAKLLVVMPRSEQMVVYAMLTGDSPLGGEGIRWPPVCESDTEWWCRQADGRVIISVDAIDQDLIASAAATEQSIWIFRADGEAGHEIPPVIQTCEPVLRDSFWRILRCLGATLRQS